MIAPRMQLKPQDNEEGIQSIELTTADPLLEMALTERLRFVVFRNIVTVL